MIRLLSAVGVNSFETFEPGKAKQLVVCNPDGYVIGDGILFFLDENKVRLVGRPSAHNWVQYHGETGDYDVSFETGRAHGGEPDRQARAVPVPGPGPDRDGGAREGDRRPAARDQVLQPRLGRDRGPQGARSAPRHVRHQGPGAVRPLGGGRGRHGRRSWRPARASSACARSARACTRPTRSSRAGSPARCRRSSPARTCRRTASGCRPRATRARARSAAASTRDDIEDYYLTPHDLGYWGFVKFDHDFIGREALEAIGDEPKRQKVTLAWNGEDVAAAMGTPVREGRPGEVHRPAAVELLHLAVRQGPRTTASRSASRPSPATASTSARCCRWRSSTRTWRSAPRSRWSGARRSGGSAKPVVERHRQAEIRAVVSPCPYSEVARTSYHEGWRSKATA